MFQVSAQITEVQELLKVFRKEADEKQAEYKVEHETRYQAIEKKIGDVLSDMQGKVEATQNFISRQQVSMETAFVQQKGEVTKMCSDAIVM